MCQSPDVYNYLRAGVLYIRIRRIYFCLYTIRTFRTLSFVLDIPTCIIKFNSERRKNKI